jgi:hypothetical protein
LKVESKTEKTHTGAEEIWQEQNEGRAEEYGEAGIKDQRYI